MTLIRNIIFDFGGVIYDIDFQRSIAEFQKLGLDNFDQLYSRAIQDKLFENLETDDCSPQEFLTELHSYFDTKVSETQIEAAWNALLIGYRHERLQMLKELSKCYNIYLLSNTNRIHYEIFIKEFEEMTGFKSFNELFKKAYLSFNIKCRKPDLEAYLHVLKDARIDAHETLFIDDSFQNIQPAIDVGLHTHFLDLSKGEDVLDLFDGHQLKSEILKAKSK